jgi:hypothetical protein
MFLCMVPCYMSANFTKILDSLHYKHNVYFSFVTEDHVKLGVGLSIEVISNKRSREGAAVMRPSLVDTVDKLLTPLS